MALPLESTIMTEIGLGDSFQWLNGSGSCEYIRKQAAHKLEETIKKHADAGEQIVQPIPQLISLMNDAASWDSNQYVLTLAWQVASYIIAEHIHLYEANPAMVTERVNNLIKFATQM